MATNYNFKENDLRDTLQTWAAAHDHDGTNSTAVTVGTVADDAVTTAKILDGALSADATGRAKMANGFVTATQLATDAVTTIKITDANVTLAKLATTAKYRIFNYQVEDLGAGADIADRVIFFAPTGLDVTLVSASIVAQGSAAGVDDSNPCVIKLSDGTNTIIETTYDSSPAFPAAAAVTSLGSLDGTYKALAAGEKLYLSVTNGATANPPAFMLQVVYSVADAA